jgi:hypothetical protein
MADTFTHRVVVISQHCSGGVSLLSYDEDIYGQENYIELGFE